MTVIVAATWILFGLAWLVFVDWYDLAWYLDIPAMIMLPICLGLLIAETWTLMIRPLLIRRYVGRASAELSGERARPGETVGLRYQRPVRAEVDARRIVTLLIVREAVQRYERETRLTDVRDQVISRYERPGRRYAPGEVVDVEAHLRIPRHGMLSFTSKDRAVTWLAQVRIESRAVPDVVDELPFAVVPVTAAVPGAVPAV